MQAESGGWWSPEDVALLQSLAEETPAWDKVRVSPELFGISRRGLELVDYLRDRELRVGSPFPDEDGLFTSIVEGPRGQEMSVLFAEEPVVVQHLGTWPDDAMTRRALAYTGVEGCERLVAVVGDGLSISIRLPFGRSRDRLKQLHTCASDVMQALDQRLKQPFAAHDDLIQRFVASGLAVPRIPSAMQAKLALLDEWRWSTRAEPVETRMTDYLMETAEYLSGPVKDHTTVSHGGHGANSYALTWRVAFGPVAALVQDGWGGGYTTPRANGSLAELFHHVGQLLEVGAERMKGVADPPRGDWIRPVLLAVSPLRGVTSLSVWDPLRAERVPISARDFWSEASSLVERCAIPGGSWGALDAPQDDGSR